MGLELGQDQAPAQVPAEAVHSDVGVPSLQVALCRGCVGRQDEQRVGL
jgi:hypothetical protein